MKKILFFIIFSKALFSQQIGFAFGGEVALGGMIYPFSPIVSGLANYEIVPNLFIEGRVGITPIDCDYQGWEICLNSFYNINGWLNVTAGINYHENKGHIRSHKNGGAVLASDIFLYGIGLEVSLSEYIWLEAQYYKSFKNKDWAYTYDIFFTGYEKYWRTIKGLFRLGFKVALDV